LLRNDTDGGTSFIYTLGLISVADLNDWEVYLSARPDWVT